MYLKIHKNIYLNIVFLCATVFRIQRTTAEPIFDKNCMRYLLTTQKYVIKQLNSYVNGMKMNIDFLKRYMTRFETELSKAEKDESSYLNPINCYILMRGLSQDFTHIENFLKQYTTYRRLPNLKYPTQEDFNSMTSYVTYLVNVYKLDVYALARGNITVRSPLTSSDCYELAMAAYNNYYNATALEWMLQALEKYHDDCFGRSCPYNEWNVLVFISIIHFDLERYETSLTWLERSRYVKDITSQQVSAYERQKNYIKEAIQETRKSLQEEFY